MRNKLRIILLAVSALVLIILGWHFYGQSREPKYAGKSVSYWFRQYYRSSSQGGRFDPDLNREAGEALNSLGTNAIPYLLEQAFVTKRDSAMRTNLHRVMRMFPVDWNIPTFVSWNVIRSEAAMAIREIRPPARLILPTLEKSLAKTNSASYLQALFLLGCVGEDAEKGVPHLLTAFKARDPGTRGLALQSLYWIGPHAVAAAPELLNMFEVAGYRMDLVRTLGAMGSNSAPALPKLKALFEKETNWNSRCLLAGTLVRIDAGQTEALSFLTNALTSPRSGSNPWSITYQLGEIGPGGLPALPALLEALRGTNLTLWTHIPYALKKIGVAPEVYFPILEEKLKSDDETARYNAATKILSVQKDHSGAIAALAGCIGGKSAFEDAAIKELGYLGPSAKAAAPAIRGALTHNQPWVRKSAAKALKKIESPQKQ
jgi:HEAT repeat protein